MIKYPYAAPIEKSPFTEDNQNVDMKYWQLHYRVFDEEANIQEVIATSWHGNQASNN